MDPNLAVSVPTLNEWGMVIVAGLMLAAASYAIARKLRSH